jgi:hypothetical protein
LPPRADVAGAFVVAADPKAIPAIVTLRPAVAEPLKDVVGLKETIAVLASPAALDAGVMAKSDRQ